MSGGVDGAAFRNPYGKLPGTATPGDRIFQDYFATQTSAIERKSLAELTAMSAADGEQSRWVARRQLFEMLGLDPLPEKTDLKATVTGTVEHMEFTVEKLHFQSRPGLYVTANLYLPKGASGPAPAILYLCGHARVVTNGVSYGSKVAYQHHPIWFARNGYVCLIIDSVELGEIQGQHHGTHRENRWWWNSRGYTAAAAEAWNCIRALDYLETRPEVDGSRIGVTGRSGGGAYSWWVAALDERIKVACPVAGITDLRNHVVDGVLEGHCDCMFTVNTYCWDYAQVAALVAPRPLLLCNSDKDTIFPLDGVVRVHEQVRSVYEALGASDRLGLLITEGPHSDTQDLQVPVFRWFNRWLKSDRGPIEKVAVPMFTGQQLKVFAALPGDEITSTCDEHFTVLASDNGVFEPARVKRDLRLKTFGGWPSGTDQVTVTEAGSVSRNGIQLRGFEFLSQANVPLRFYVVSPVGREPKAVRFEVVDEVGWREFVSRSEASFGEVVKAVMPHSQAKGAGDQVASMLPNGPGQGTPEGEARVVFAPRGVGTTAYTSQPPYSTHLRRRFMQLGQTLAGMQVWDVTRAMKAIGQVPDLAGAELQVSAAPEMTEVAAFASIFGPRIASLSLAQAPRTDKEAPDFLNWSRVLTPEQLLELARASSPVAVRVGSGDAQRDSTPEHTE